MEKNTPSLIHTKFLELHFYIVSLFDLLLKTKKISKARNFKEKIHLWIDIFILKGINYQTPVIIKLID